jgi:hypothetical protein
LLGEFHGLPQYLPRGGKWVFNGESWDARSLICTSAVNGGENTSVDPNSIGAISGPANGGMWGQLRPAGTGKQINHMPADWSTGGSITKYSGPSIRMDTADHAQLYTTGSSREARAWRQWQQELIGEGRIDEAMQMDINDVRARFGTKYDAAIVEMIDSLPDNAQYQALRKVPMSGDVLPGLPWSNADPSP